MVFDNLRPGYGTVTESTSRNKQPARQRYRPYPAYKESGAKWLCTIPTTWEVQPLKYLVTFSTGWTPPTGRDDLYGGEHRWANISDLGPKVLKTTEKTITDAAIKESRLSKVNAGTLLFSFKLSIGTVSIAGVSMYTNEAIAAFAPSSRIDTGFLFWAAPVLIPQNAQDNIYGAPLLNQERIANAKLLIPALAEQQAIADFLDRETARIDALVERKERLIELLREKRAALVTRAVTRGLDPNVPMKDSGVEWLGEIPAHWGLRQLRRVVTTFVDYRGKTPEKTRAGVRLVTARNVKKQSIDFSLSEEFIPQHLYRKWMVRGYPERGDVLVTTEAPLGETAQITDTNVALAQRIILLKANKEKIIDDYLKYHFVSDSGRMELQTRATGSTALGVKASHLKASLILVPPKCEQAAISKKIASQTSDVDKLIAKVLEAIDRLLEYRNALISAAVTGKIDVRNESS